MIGKLFRLLRVKQWTKNLIIFVPVLFAGKIHDVSVVERAVLCFAAFCMLSSSIYVINDVFDLEQDKRHPIKCRRPIAAGEISTNCALCISAVCAFVGLLLMSLTSWSVCAMGVFYIALTTMYSLILKKYVLLDVLAIALGFVLRAVAGAACVPVWPTGWFVLCTSLGALFLALDKRRQELQVLQEQAGDHRKALNSYSLPLLKRAGNVIAFCLLGCYMLFSALSYHGQTMLLTVPFAIYGVIRYQQLVASAHTTAEDILVRDRRIQVAIVLWAATALLAVYRHV